VFRRPVFLILGLLVALVLPASAGAVIDYPNFASTAGLTLGGDAKQDGDVLRLTPALPNKRGTAYSSSQVNTGESFENQFVISMHDSTCCENPPTTGLKPADGMAFVIQSQGLTAGEGLGGSLGYSGIKPSVIVEFDIFYNLGEPLTDHVSIMKDGNGGVHLQCANAGPTPTCSSNLPFPLYGAPVYGWVEYDATAQHLKVWLSQTATKPAAPLLDYAISLATLGPAAYVGFTAATGAHNAIQDVLSWRQGGLGSLNPTTLPGTVQPEEKKAKKGCKKKKAKGKGKSKGKQKGASSSKKKKKKPKCRKKKGKGKAKGHSK
jgi:Legume lectin domain